VLFATSECVPWVKTGGLGDVAGALTAALRRDGIDARVLMPAYRSLSARAGKVVAAIDATPLLPAATLLDATLPSGVPALLVDCPSLFDRDGGPYQDTNGIDYADNAQRFAMLSRVAALLALDSSPFHWRPEVLHCNDWQTAPAPALVHFAGRPRARTLLTIHNLAFQGVFDGDLTSLLGLPREAFGIDGVEYYGRTSFLKAGLVFADALSTVSHTYAREIQRAPLGMGLEGVLAARRNALTGILNGIDNQAWDPAADPLIEANYDATTLVSKARNKAALQRELGLDERPERPLFGVVSRLTEQKGSDLVAALAERIASLPAQLAVLGSGDAGITARFQRAALAHPRSVAKKIGFDEGLAHRIEAGADFFLMPSRFEPCGLNQMYSQRYGTPPIAHATGGLIDSVIDATPQTLENGTATGFLFAEPTESALWSAMMRALEVYAHARKWQAIQRAGMARDFSWQPRSREYAALYRKLVGGGEGG
jgi:starch synthase